MSSCSDQFGIGAHTRVGWPLHKWAAHTHMAVYMNGSACTMHIVIYLEQAGPIKYVLVIYMFPMQRLNQLKIFFLFLSFFLFFPPLPFFLFFIKITLFLLTLATNHPKH